MKTIIPLARNCRSERASNYLMIVTEGDAAVTVEKRITE